MAQPFLVVASDLHLTPHAWAKHPTLRGDAYCSLQQIVDLAIAHAAPLILLGDIFDEGRPDSESVLFFYRQMARMAEAGLAVDAIEGNHDGTRGVPWCRIHPWVRWVNRQSFQIGPFQCYGLDYHARGVLATELAAVPPGTDVLFCHQAWSDVQGIGNTDGSFADIHHARYLFTGDYHTHRWYQGANAQGQPLLAFSPGSTCMQATDEDPYKHVYLLYEHPDHPREIMASSHMLVTRPFYQRVLHTEEEFAAAMESLRPDPPPAVPGFEDIAKPLLRIKYQDTIENAYNRIHETCGDRYHLFLDVIHGEVEITPVHVPGQTESPAGNFDTLETGLYAMHAQGAITEAEYNSAVRLLRSQNRTGEFNALFEEYYQSVRNQLQAVPPGNLVGTGDGAGGVPQVSV